MRGERDEREGKKGGGSHFQTELSRDQCVVMCPREAKGFYLIMQVVHKPEM